MTYIGWINAYEVAKMDYGDIFNNARWGAGRPAKHPFSAMAVGDVVVLDDPKMQGYAHTFGQKSGRKFTTRKVDGKIYVKRLS